MANESQRLDLKKRIAHLEEEISLARFSELKVGGHADFYTEATTTIELVEAVTAALELQMPYLVIGKGHHIIFSDSGFPGLIISNQASTLAYDSERSQIVVDSGLVLASCVTQLASRGFGGLTPFFGEKGSIGSAVYRDLTVGGYPFTSLVRSINVLMPPTLIKPEATIARFRSEWLRRDGAANRLKALREETELFTPQPVLLTLQLQLTSNRTDEIASRLTQQLAKYPAARKNRLGPVFAPLPNQSVSAVLRGLQAERLRVGGVMVDKNYPNYLRAVGVVTAADVRKLIEELAARAEEAGVKLKTRYEYEGVW